MKLFLKFCKHINYKAYFKSDDKILLAVSGGIDSMVLVDLMIKGDYSFSIAHVDHGTRDGQSGIDASFVEQFCEEHQIPFYTKQLRIADVKGNFHHIAHEERYAFFKSLGFKKILTAHHQDDHIESILISVINGRSCEGILEYNHPFIRPLWPFSKQNILDYALEHKIEYVNDASNQENKYLRNIIRNQVFPALEPVLPDYKNRLASLSERLSEDNALLERLAGNKFPVINHKDYDEISLVTMSSDLDKELLFYSLKSYGANKTITRNIADINEGSGSLFYTSSHSILYDRGRLLIKPIEIKVDKSINIKIEKLPFQIQYGKYSFEFSACEHLPTPIGSNELYIPRKLLRYKLKDELSEDLSLRNWEEGDQFKPFGLDGKSKSLKKFFIDQKVNIYDKGDIPLLMSGKEIVWVVGLRSSETYRCKNGDRDLLRVSFVHDI